MRKLRFVAAALRKHPRVFCALPLLFALVGAVGCGGGGGTSAILDNLPNPIPSPLQPFVPNPIPSPSPTPAVTWNTSAGARYDGVFPVEGKTGDFVNIRTRNIDYSRYPSYKVFFNDVEATELTLMQSTDGFRDISCRVPPGTGRVHVGLRFYNPSGEVIASLSTSDEDHQFFTYAQ